MSNNENNTENMELMEYDEFENVNEILFNGFIREISNKVAIRQIVPHHIILLVSSFFHIDSMKRLEQRRKDALEVKDNDSILDIEQLIFYKACSSSLNTFNREMLDKVIANWFVDNTDEYFAEPYRNSIIQCAHQCLWSDNVDVLQVIFKKCQYERLLCAKKSSFTALERRRMDELICFINVAIMWNAFECAKYLLEHADKFDWTNEFLPDILLNAVIHQHKNVNFVWFVINQLEKNEIAFKCITFKNKWDDIMEKVIEFDLPDIAQRIVGKGWHQVTQNNRTFATHLNKQHPNECYRWLKERSANYLDVINCNTMQIELDDPEWGDTETEWDSESDDTVEY